MRSHTVSTLARREIRDALSDWRIALPMIVLTLFLPLLVRSAAVFAIRVLEQPDLAPKLIPFALLLVGFVPVSFSLIPALETFVGERERNTLESLLSAPIADRDIYLGKFMAGLLPPLLSGMLAMSTFAVTVKLGVNHYISASMSPFVFLSVLALVIVKAVTMVSAALLVSSRTTSIRSANLLASFIIIPMSILVQFEALLMISDPPRFWTVALIGVGLLLLSTFLLVSGLGFFSREEILAREHQPIFSLGTRVQAPQRRTARSTSARQRPPLLTVIRREIRDTVTDWRILLPILLLALVLPLLLLGAAIYAVRATEAPNDIARLVPFGLLLVGFLPSSFSLITALESFVGEKERGSLESLFSMPLSDKELYFGKLLATLTTPLFSGLLAMAIFALGLVLVAPPILAVQVMPETLVAMAALVIAIAATMVTGAVVISSHTSSIRVANLLASFILLPMSVVIQLIALYSIARAWDIIGLTGIALFVIAGILVNAGLRSFNREEILSREHEGLSLGHLLKVFGAYLRQHGPLTQPPEARLERFSVRRFYTRELPQMLRELRVPLLLVLLGVLGAIVFGIYFDPHHRSRLMQSLVPVNRIDRVPHGGLDLAVIIFISNLFKIFWAGVLSALTFGVFAALVPLFAFASVAHGATWAESHGKSLGALGFLLAYALPHGLIELPTAILASAAGIRLGLAAATTPPGAGISIGRHLLWALAFYLRLFGLVIVPLLLLAALVEGLITPLVAAAVYR